MNLEVEVRRAELRIAGVAVVTDDLTLQHRSAEALVAVEVSVVIAGSVVADERYRVATKRVEPKGREAGGNGVDRNATRGNHVDTLVLATARPWCTPGVAVRRARHRADDRIDVASSGVDRTRIAAAAARSSSATTCTARGTFVRGHSRRRRSGFTWCEIDVWPGPSIGPNGRCQGGEACTRIGDRTCCCLGFTPGLLFKVSAFFCELGSEGALHRFVVEASFFDFAESDDFVLGLSLQPAEHDLLCFDVAFVFAEFDFVGDQFFLRNVVPVENLAPCVRQHVDKDFSLDLILRCQNAGEKRDARDATAHESRNGDGLDIATQQIDRGLQPIAFQLE